METENKPEDVVAACARMREQERPVYTIADAIGDASGCSASPTA
jgi:hypothetical protein